MDNIDQVEEFTVIFSYSYFTTNNSDESQGDMSGEDVTSPPYVDSDTHVINGAPIGALFPTTK